MLLHVNARRDVVNALFRACSSQNHSRAGSYYLLPEHYGLNARSKNFRDKGCCDGGHGQADCSGYDARSALSGSAGTDSDELSGNMHATSADSSDALRHEVHHYADDENAHYGDDEEYRGDEECRGDEVFHDDEVLYEHGGADQPDGGDLCRCTPSDVLEHGHVAGHVAEHVLEHVA